MEFFILALIHRVGLTSIYEFQQRAGLQPGGIRPALARLEQRNLINRSESAARRRRDFALTSDGLALLHGAWQQCLNDHTELEAVLRAAFVAVLMGGVDQAIAYLFSLATTRRATADEKAAEAERFKKTQGDPLSAYTWMRAATESHRRSAESDAFLQLSQYLEANIEIYGKSKQQPATGVEQHPAADPTHSNSAPQRESNRNTLSH
jgi:DNA-binding MarR family transcriptional regulator